MRFRKTRILTVASFKTVGCESNRSPKIIDSWRLPLLKYHLQCSPVRSLQFGLLQWDIQPFTMYNLVSKIGLWTRIMSPCRAMPQSIIRAYPSHLAQHWQGLLNVTRPWKLSKGTSFSLDHLQGSFDVLHKASESHLCSVKVIQHLLSSFQTL